MKRSTVGSLLFVGTLVFLIEPSGESSAQRAETAKVAHDDVGPLRAVSAAPVHAAPAQHDNANANAKSVAVNAGLKGVSSPAHTPDLGASANCGENQV
ncbi:hypothetical protein G6O45_25695, partial [Salmonella enterica subsp. enterica serovar Istanbul]|nr:hypothetical protein [Salmonella enterica subsp. enterica serovar Istanbul]